MSFGYLYVVSVLFISNDVNAMEKARDIFSRICNIYNSTQPQSIGLDPSFYVCFVVAFVNIDQM